MDLDTLAVLATLLRPYLGYKERMIASYTCQTWGKYLREKRDFGPDSERDLIDQGHIGLYLSLTSERRKAYRFAYPWETIPLLFHSPKFPRSLRSPRSSDAGEDSEDEDEERTEYERYLVRRMVWLYDRGVTEEEKAMWGKRPEDIVLEMGPIEELDRGTAHLLHLVETSPDDRMYALTRVEIRGSDIIFDRGFGDPIEIDHDGELVEHARVEEALSLGVYTWALRNDPRGILQDLLNVYPSPPLIPRLKAALLRFHRRDLLEKLKDCLDSKKSISRAMKALPESLEWADRDLIYHALSAYWVRRNNDHNSLNDPDE